MGAARLKDLQAHAQAQLATALPPSEARLEAQLLLAHALGVNRAWLIAHDTDRLTPTQVQVCTALLTRRLAGEPVAYLLGEREFYGRPFHVTPATLIPRPETELLVDLALERLPPDQPATILDLGTGTGCIALTLALERPWTHVTAVDASPDALAVAQDNAARLGANNARFLEADWFTPRRHSGASRNPEAPAWTPACAGVTETTWAQTFDLIASNPPYVAAADPHLSQGDVRFEPQTALAAGADGLDDLRRIIAAAPVHLNPGGWLLLEHGWDQGEAVPALLRAAGFIDVACQRDLAGQPRVSLGRRP